MQIIFLTWERWVGMKGWQRGGRVEIIGWKTGDQWAWILMEKIRTNQWDVGWSDRQTDRQRERERKKARRDGATHTKKEAKGERQHPEWAHKQRETDREREQEMKRKRRHDGETTNERREIKKDTDTEGRGKEGRSWLTRLSLVASFTRLADTTHAHTHTHTYTHPSNTDTPCCRWD